MSTGNIEIRRAVLQDCDRVWPLVQAFATSYIPDHGAYDRAFSQLIDRQDTLLLVAESEAVGIVGYTLANCHGTLFANGNVAWVEEVMVTDSERLGGVGRALMDEVEEWAKSVPVSYICLATRRADAFYGRLGYQLSASFFKKEMPG
jgi:GNAT superfamily N-acetyltransferase